MTRRFALLAMFGTLLAACGRKGPLQPPPGDEESEEEMRADDRATDADSITEQTTEPQ